MKVSVVVGGQYGSEAKGHVTHQIIRDEFNPVLNIRVAGPNAGHSARDGDGVMHAFRSVPIGLTLPHVRGHIAAGSEVDLAVLVAEMRELHDVGLPVAGRLTVDPEVTLLEPEHKQTEADASLVDLIGSTGKGIGAARAARLMRKARRLIDDEQACKTLRDYGVDVQGLNLDDLVGHTHVVVEGTQGFGLGLHAGFYPQCTSSDTRAIDFLAMAGISPWDHRIDDLDVWVVFRPYPIRVAGNSGPLVGETSWEDLGLPVERTTVTKKVRRVGAWDAGLAWRAVEANGGAGVRIALTMVDQVIPALAGVSSQDAMAKVFGQQNDISPVIAFNDLLNKVHATGGRIGMITTSDDTAVWMGR